MVAARVRARSLTGAPSAPPPPVVSVPLSRHRFSRHTSDERRGRRRRFTASRLFKRTSASSTSQIPCLNTETYRCIHTKRGHANRYRIRDDDRRITQPNNTRTPGRGQPSRRYHGARHGAHLLFTLSPHEDRTVFFMHLLPSLAPAFRKAVPALGQLIRFLTAIPHPPLWQWTAILLPAARKQHEAS